MAPAIFDMIALCKERGIACGFNSNATLLTGRIAARLIDLELDWLHVSLDGAGKESYEFVRDQSSWDIVERNISRLAAMLRERGAPRPQLSLVIVLMRNNLAELPGVVRRAAEWGIPRVRAQNLSHDFSDAEPGAFDAIADFVEEQSVVSMPSAEVAAIFEEARRVAAESGVSLRLPGVEAAVAQTHVDGAPVPCAWPWRSSYVNWDGTVQPCCMVMGSERFSVGRLRPGESFADLWHAADYASFREKMLAADPPAICSGCSEYRGTF
jgi:radical SAM protein with 4Fe4S-binding SPASM domain